MFRLVTLNLNGIRSAATKGLRRLGRSERRAIVWGCRRSRPRRADVAGRFEHVGRHAGHFHFAQKKGYSGVGLYARKTPSDVITGFGDAEFDAEGRYVEVRFDNARRKLSIISCYFPERLQRRGAAGGQVPLPRRCSPAPARLKAEREFILVRRRQHRAPGDRPEELAQQPEEQRLPARGARLDDATLLDAARPGRRVPHAATRHPEQLHLVEQPRPGLGQERRLAARLPPGHARRSPRWRARARSTSTQRFSDHAPLMIDYDFKL